jgi:hypothetical protein
LQPGHDHALKFAPHDHEIETEDQASLRGALQPNDRDLDRVEYDRGWGLA